MPKKVPQNAFYFFMKDLQQEYREGGRTIPMKDMAALAHPLYKDLPRERKLFYEQKAKAGKAIRKDTELGRYTSDGIPIQQLQQAEAEEEKTRIEMCANIHSLITENMYKITDTPVYIISFNILVGTQEGLYLPNEIGLVEYTFRDGIKGSYHRLINPGGVPVGYYGEAKLHSEKFHQLPVMMSEVADSDSNYTKILRDILKFVNAKQKKQLVFCRLDQMEQTVACYDWLQSVAESSRYSENISFYDLGEFFTQLCEVMGSGMTRTMVDDHFENNGFDYAINSRCDYHEELDCCYCALGFSRKMCFIMSDYLVEKFKLQLTGAHLPERNSCIYQVESPKAYPNLPNLANLTIDEATRFISSTDDDDDDNEELDPRMPQLQLQTAPAVVSTSSTLPKVPVNVPASSFLGRGGGIGRGRPVFQ